MCGMSTKPAYMGEPCFGDPEGLKLSYARMISAHVAMEERAKVSTDPSARLMATWHLDLVRAAEQQQFEADLLEPTLTPVERVRRRQLGLTVRQMGIRGVGLPTV